MVCIVCYSLYSVYSVYSVYGVCSRYSLQGVRISFTIFTFILHDVVDISGGNQRKHILITGFREQHNAIA